MDLSGPMFDNIKIEADSDCAFFGLAAVNNGVPNGSLLDGAGNHKLNTLLSSASPYTISSSGSPTPVVTKADSISSCSVADSLEDNLFSTDIVEQLELDLPEFSCDFDMLENDELTNALLRDDSDSKDSGTSSTPDVYLGSPSAMDTPPLTPPSPVIKVETETKPSIGFGSIPSSILPMLKNLPNGQNLTKILPALKSSRGRSASHDSPDVQALKRHIRMIRNRESASLSRKKKKEYVTTLEQRLKEVEMENAQLRQENQLLKTRLLMQQHNSNGQNHSNSKMNGTSLPNNASGRNGANANKTKLIAKVALLGVCCFMILSAHAPMSRNHHIVPDVLSNATTTNSKVMQSFPGQADFPHHLTELPTNHLRISRSLAWQDDFKDEPTHKNLEIPERKKKTSNSSLNASSGNVGNRTQGTTIPTTKFNSHLRSHRFKHSFQNLTLPINVDVPENNCKLSFNKTESLRVQNDLKGLFNRGKLKKKAPTKPFFYSVMEVNNVDNNKGLTVYDQRMQRYSSFLDKIQLREDTFYVVSLAMDDQLLLSAKSSNASSRPKMSFLMPWRNDSVGGKEEVMQIDCEVTKVLNLNKIRKNPKP
ncbi:Cyclic AMP-dependent transcription factor ATF-6 beta [Orchesella cincta]|uniref:Cyclic AMP-dependent transcription factor ATF-6 beta n=1 Tax=Orchesella cincta TaxID=48709 RepID=A0A1D2N3D5_ORCCI|nr:Cyclic AMP-dependent transcription factor ATF-6 beta [Orchesella cincta]